MCIFSPKFGQLDVTLGLLVWKEEGNFCFTSILAAAVMAEKMTYKKRRKVSCTVD
jgi:hypothetical protein